jgi:hypothetical protein
MTFIRFIWGVFATFVIGILIFFTCWILAAGCSRAHVFVTNQSGMSLSNLVVSGLSKERHSDALAPHSEWHTATPYHRGHLIQFSFETAGQNYTTNSDACLDHSGFCAVWFTIGTNMVITSGAKY